MVSDLVKKQNISLSEVHNQNQQTKEQWYTLGYRIPRAYLAPLAIAVHDLSKPIAPPDTVPIAIWAALHGRDNILMVA